MFQFVLIEPLQCRQDHRILGQSLLTRDGIGKADLAEQLLLIGRKPLRRLLGQTVDHIAPDRTGRQVAQTPQKSVVAGCPIGDAKGLFQVQAIGQIGP